MKKRKVLAVEDEKDHLLALQMIFMEEEDCELYSARNVKEAEGILDKIDIDALILDLALPGEDGISFCQRLKRNPRYQHLPVIAFSAYPKDPYEEKALAAGCVTFVAKPFKPDKLVALVRKYSPL